MDIHEIACLHPLMSLFFIISYCLVTNNYLSNRNGAWLEGFSSFVSGCNLAKASNIARATHHFSVKKKNSSNIKLIYQTKQIEVVWITKWDKPLKAPIAPFSDLNWILFATEARHSDHRGWPSHWGQTEPANCRTQGSSAGAGCGLHRWDGPLWPWKDPRESCPCKGGRWVWYSHQWFSQSVELIHSPWSLHTAAILDFFD